MTDSRPLPKCQHFPPRSDRVGTKTWSPYGRTPRQVGRCRTWLLSPNTAQPWQCRGTARSGEPFCTNHSSWEVGNCKQYAKFAREYRKAKSDSERDCIWRIARRSMMDPDKTIALLRRTMRFAYRQNAYSLSGNKISPHTAGWTCLMQGSVSMRLSTLEEFGMALPIRDKNCLYQSFAQPNANLNERR